MCSKVKPHRQHTRECLVNVSVAALDCLPIVVDDLSNVLHERPVLTNLDPTTNGRL